MRLRLRFIATAALAALALAAIPASAVKQPKRHSLRASVSDARAAVHIAFDNYVDVTHSRLVINRCLPIRKSSRVCSVHIYGRIRPQHHRVVVTRGKVDYYVHARPAQPILAR